MRSASVFARLVLCPALFSLLSCASSKPDSPAAAIQEPSVTLEGDIALVGPGALEYKIVLADEGGSFCELRNTAFEDELRSLAGHRVRVTGHLEGRSAEGPGFFVEGYELAPENGRTPVVGVLESRGGELVLRGTPSGSEYRLVGGLARALLPFAGYKVWVSGSPASSAGQEGQTAALTVESYGVLVPAAPEESRSLRR